MKATERVDAARFVLMYQEKYLTVPDGTAGKVSDFCKGKSLSLCDESDWPY